MSKNKNHYFPDIDIIFRNLKRDFLYILTFCRCVGVSETFESSTSSKSLLFCWDFLVSMCLIYGGKG